MASSGNHAGRDLRLDFFRGVSLFIILFDHTRGNNLAQWTLGSFGFSDAACIFIFISGVTSALAFGRGYGRTSWLAASARVAQRVWQIYVAQIAIVMAVAALPGVAAALGAPDFSAALKLDYLYGAPIEALGGIVTLTYVPPGLDILPVYIVLLTMIPLVMLLARLSPRLVLPVSLALYLAARHFGWNLPADPLEQRGWYFNPFTWQLLFFTGFGIGMGWLRAPQPSRPLLALAGGFVLLAACLWIAPVWQTVPGFAGLHDWAMAHRGDKTGLDPWILMHFFVLAYLVGSLTRERMHWLARLPARLFLTAGQQSLGVFLGTVLLADIGGVAFDVLGKNTAVQAGVTSATCLALAATGYLLAWFKAAPWKPARLPVNRPPMVPAE